VAREIGRVLVTLPLGPEHRRMLLEAAPSAEWVFLGDAPPDAEAVRGAQVILGGVPVELLGHA